MKTKQVAIRTSASAAVTAVLLAASGSVGVSKEPSALGREFQGSLYAYTDNRAGQSAARYIQGVLPALDNARDIACDNAVVMPAEAGG